MADGSIAGASSLKGKVSEEEWNVRVDLADSTIAVRGVEEAR